MDLEELVGVGALYLCFAALVLAFGWYLIRDCLRHFRILWTAEAHGLEPVGMVIGHPVMVIGIALGPEGSDGDRFARSRLCAVIDGRVEPLDSEVIWRMKRDRRLVWYGLLGFTGGIGRENLMGFLRWDSHERRVPVPEYADLRFERSVFVERVLPLLVIVAVMGWLFWYVLPRV